MSGDSSDSSDSEDDVPLCNLTKPQAKDDPAPSLKREREDEDAKPEKKPKVESNDGAKAPMATDQSKPEQKPKQVQPSSRKDDSSDEDSEDDTPLCQVSKKPKPEPPKPAVKAEKTNGADSKPSHKPAVKKKKVVLSESEEDSDEDVPVSKRYPPKPSSAPTSKAQKSEKKKKQQSEESNSDEEDDESDYEEEGAKKKTKKPAAKPQPKPKPKPKDESDSDDDKPLSQSVKKTPDPKPTKKRMAPQSNSDSDDDVPLGKLKPSPKKKEKKKAPKKESNTTKEKKEEPKKDEPERYKWWLAENNTVDYTKGGKKWDYLEHNGMLFPPPYEPHGVKLLYDGEPVDLSPDAEEAATFYAQKIETDHVKKEIFRKNFWNDWRKMLGKKHTVQCLEKCDFRPIHAWLMADKEKKKAMTKEQKAEAKAAKEAIDKKYGWCKIDDHQEKIGNYRVEIPGLFMGRGEHPKQGKIKQRTMPEDVILNISEDAPEVPVPEFLAEQGHKWGGTQHDNTVTWLAMYKDSINGEHKYMMLNANSTFKGMSDLKKFEKARELKKLIKGIRKKYYQELTSKEDVIRQRATALYLIDKLALRVGGDKDTEDEADTVGCCSLRHEHVEFYTEEATEQVDGDEKQVTKYMVHFDFLGKDSIRYDEHQDLKNKLAWENMRKFKVEAAKRSNGPGDKEGQLFKKLNPADLNKYLTSLMPGLTAKVFRTYNASYEMDKKTAGVELAEGLSVPEKLVYYNQWNRDVAILCNHQRAKPKTFDASMEKIQARLDEAKRKHAEAKKAAKQAKKDGDEKARTKFKKQAETLQGRVDTIENQMQVKEDTATVSLGTSKINYIDPRISVAWCKRMDVPLTKIFTKTLIQKFEWATDVEDDWRF